MARRIAVTRQRFEMLRFLVTFCFPNIAIITIPVASLKNYFRPKGRSDIHCKINETLYIGDLKPALNEIVVSEKLLLLLAIYIFPADLLTRSVYFHLLFIVITFLIWY